MGITETSSHPDEESRGAPMEIYPTPVPLTINYLFNSNLPSVKFIINPLTFG
jgi:hypothetical protein